jgi:hypothetical protein
LKVTPKGNPIQFARRLGLESVIRMLEGAIFEYAEVQEILEKKGKVITWSIWSSGRTVEIMNGSRLV